MRLIRRQSNNKQSKKLGFTLLEMLVVVLIIGLLVTIVVVNVAHYPTEARVETAKTQISSFGTALDMYNIHNSHYPSTEQGLAALVEKPTGFPEPRDWGPKPYLKGKKIPDDPWGNPFEYKLNNDGSYTIISYGSDGEQGGDEYAADINSDDL